MDIVNTVVELGKLSAFVMPIVMSLVTLWGSFGVKGKWQLVSSLATGLVFGGGLGYWQLSNNLTTLSNTTQVGNVLASTLYGLITGLTASGLYEVGKAAVAKGYEIAFAKRELG